jgi:hypothetical protein
MVMTVEHLKIMSDEDWKSIGVPFGLRNRIKKVLENEQF